MNLNAMFTADLPPVIALVGGGGKTTLMFGLAAWLGQQGRRVLTTTTTQIYPPEAKENYRLLLVPEEKDLAGILQQTAEYASLTVAMRMLPSGKLQGLPPEWVDRIADWGRFDTIVVEADGAAGKSLKGHAPWEPVVPRSTRLFIGVVGIDIIGKPLNNFYVHRPEIVAAHTGLTIGESLDVAAVARTITHPKGYAARCPSKCEAIIAITKVKTKEEQLQAFSLRDLILASGIFNRVIIV